MSKARPVPRKTRRFSGLLGVAVAIAIVVGLSAFLHARVALTQVTLEKTPLTVATTTFQLQEDYRRTVSYLGLIVAGRKTDLSFELPGRIASLPVRQGSLVAAGDLIAQLDDAALRARRDATSADLKRARVELELAKLKAKRQKDLRATGAVSKEAFDETRLRALALEAQVEAVIAGLASIDIDLEKSRLVTPYDGIVADHYVHEGTVINPGVPVVRLIEITQQEAHIGVSAIRAGELVIGKNYPLKLRGKEVEAALLSVRPDVDPVTRSTTAVFQLPGQVSALDGEPITLELDETMPLAGGWLPISALLEGKRGLWTVLRIDSSGEQYSTLREAVEVLDIQQDKAYVRGTLPDGSMVVASGMHRITPGTPIALEKGS
jgi:RND family efflux transporter MFP subunit